MDLVQELTAMLEKAFPAADVDVKDPNNDGAHLEATVIAPQFEGKSRLEQHRMVYAALGDMMDERVHALKLTTSAKQS